MKPEGEAVTNDDAEVGGGQRAEMEVGIERERRGSESGELLIYRLWALWNVSDRGRSAANGHDTAREARGITEVLGSDTSDGRAHV